MLFMHKQKDTLLNVSVFLTSLLSVCVSITNGQYQWWWVNDDQHWQKYTPQQSEEIEMQYQMIPRPPYGFVTIPNARPKEYVITFDTPYYWNWQQHNDHNNECHFPEFAQIMDTVGPMSQFSRKTKGRRNVWREKIHTFTQSLDAAILSYKDHADPVNMHPKLNPAIPVVFGPRAHEIKQAWSYYEEPDPTQFRIIYPGLLNDNHNPSQIMVVQRGVASGSYQLDIIDNNKYGASYTSGRYQTTWYSLFNYIGQKYTGIKQTVLVTWIDGVPLYLCVRDNKLYAVPLEQVEQCSYVTFDMMDNTGKSGSFRYANIWIQLAKGAHWDQCKVLYVTDAPDGIGGLVMYADFRGNMRNPGHGGVVTSLPPDSQIHIPSAGRFHVQKPAVFS